MSKQIKDVALTAIKPYENNPRKNENAVEKVAESIKAFGFQQPIVVDKDNVIIAGHTRYKAAELLGLKKVPVIKASELSEEEVKAYRLADNKVAEFSDWDFELLDAELEGIEEIDMEAFGFSEIGGGTVTIEDDDFDEEKEKIKPITKEGQVYELGDHRLMCGDSSSADDMKALMDGEKGNLCFTDPPYGVSIGDKNKMLNTFQKAGRCTENIENDTLGTEELYDLLVSCFRNLKMNMKKDAAYYVTSPQGGEIGLMMMMMMKDAGLEVRHNLIWKKNAATFSMGQLDYDYQHEPIFYTWGDKHNFYGTGYQTTIWEFDKPRKCDLHPTMKPVPLIAHAIENSSKKGDIVVDIFGGSGSTLIACEDTKRKCRMMELDPHYCDVIIARWEEHTGKKAKRIQ